MGAQKNHLIEMVLLSTYNILVFPPAHKKGMVKFSGKGQLSVRQQAKRALLNARRQAKRALFKSMLEVECGIVIYKFILLSIMQLLSVYFFKCKIYYFLNNYYFRIF